MNNTRPKPDEFLNKVIKLFNAFDYEVNSNVNDSYVSTYNILLTKGTKRVKVNISMRDIFLALSSNECIDLEKNPKKVYYINYKDLDYFTRNNVLNKLLND